MKIVCQLRYHGGYTAGWQEQPNEISIASELKSAIHKFTGERVALACAGRTDKGVHAVGQVISFDTTQTRSLSKWKTGLNHFLPDYIAINEVIDHHPDFHPRFHALARTYRYYAVVNNRPHGERIITTLYKKPCLQKMNLCAQMILGTHDFSKFRGGSCQALSPIKTCQEAFWSQKGSLLCFQITADAFLHHMVRYLVGCMLQVGLEQRSLEWFHDLIHMKQDQDFCAPGEGLYFCHAHYHSELTPGFEDQRPWFDY